MGIILLWMHVYFNNNIKDIAFFTGKGEQTFVKIGEGIFAIFFPEDAHAPGLMVKSIPTQVKKVVVKVPVEG